MPLGNPNKEPEGDADYIIGTGHNGQRMDSTAMLMTSSGKPVTVRINGSVYPKNLKVESDNPVTTTESQPVSNLPKMEAVNALSIVQGIIPTKMGKGFTLIPNFDCDVWVTQHIEEGTSWIIPYEGRVIRVVHRSDWNKGVQKLVSMLVKDDGPLDPALSDSLEDILEHATKAY